jgi:hypothetical protein
MLPKEKKAQGEVDNNMDKKVAPRLSMNPTHVVVGHRSLLEEATPIGSLHHSRIEKTDMHIALAVTVTHSSSNLTHLTSNSPVSCRSYI